MSIDVDPGSIIERLYSYWKARRSKGEYEARRRFFETRKSLEKEGTLEEFLISYYRDLSNDIYKIGPLNYAIAMPNTWRRVLPIDAVLGSLSIQAERERMIDVEKVCEVAMFSFCNYVSQKISPWEGLQVWTEGPDKNWIKNCFFPGETFALAGIDVKNKEIKMSHYISDYYSYISTCEYLSYELIKEFDEHGNTWREDALQRFQLPVREKLASGNRIYDFEKRSAKVGINIFLVGHIDEDLCCVLAYRGKAVAEFPGRYSVVPAGAFSPRGPSYREWYSIKLSVFAELIEECVKGIDEIEKPKTMSTEWMYTTYPFLNNLRQSLSEGKSRFMFTAVGIDLLTAKPEVCGTLYLGDDLFLELLRGKLNFETKFAEKYQLNDKELLKFLKPGIIAPAGAVSVIEGLRFCEDELGVETVLSDIA